VEDVGIGLAVELLQTRGARRDVDDLGTGCCVYPSLRHPSLLCQSGARGNSTRSLVGTATATRTPPACGSKSAVHRPVRGSGRTTEASVGVEPVRRAAAPPHSRRGHHHETTGPIPRGHHRHRSHTLGYTPRNSLVALIV